MTIYPVLQRHIGGCREWPVNGDRCDAPSEFVLWGKLIPPEGLGPRCYDHAAKHVGHRALSSRSYSLISLRRLAQELDDEKEH